MALAVSIGPAFSQSDTRALGKEALQKALNAAEKNPLAGDRSALNRRAAILMAQIDPQAALPILPGITRPSDTIEALGAVAAALAPQDKTKAQELILQATKILRELPDDNQRRAELALLCSKIVYFDPAGAFTAARGIEDPPVFEDAWLSLARIAPSAALTDLKTITLPQQKARLAAGLLPILAPADLPGALALGEEISDSLMKSQALAEAVFVLPPVAAFGVAQRIPDTPLRNLAIRAAAERLAPSDLDSALAMIEELGPEADSARAGLALAVVKSDTLKALELIAKLANASVRRDALGLLLVQFSESDLAAARNLLDNPETPAWALPAYYGALAKTDIGGAFGEADKIADPKYRSLALARVAHTAAPSSPELAEKILWEVAPGDRQPALKALVSALAPQSPNKAAGLTGLAADADQVLPLRLAIAEGIASNDLTEALRLAKTGAPSPERTELLLGFAAQLAGTDKKQALSVAALAVGEANAGRALAGRLAPNHPTLAISYANSIDNHYQRAWAFFAIAETLLSPGEKNNEISRNDILRVVEGGGEAADIVPIGGVEILQAQPHSLKVRLAGVNPETLYTIRAQTPAGIFIWENLKPQADNSLLLQDDGHLQAGLRLRCPSRGLETDPAYFDDYNKGQWQGKHRLPYGVPVSTFGGPGYLATAATWVERDVRGNFWIYQDLRPWRIANFDENFNYRFSLAFPHRLKALTCDAQARLYVLEEGNLLSRFDADGRPMDFWRLPEGYREGEFQQASGVAIDPIGDWIYLADEKLSRVQRFDDELRSSPVPVVPWGWLGREDLSYLESGAYDQNSKYRLDRPRRLALGPKRLLYADCAYYVMRFDLTNGNQAPFGVNGVLGWGGTFTDSANSLSAAANAHWQEHILAGIDPQGNIYISDTANAYVNNLRLQSFSPDGGFLEKYDLDREITAADGSRIYLVPPLGMAFAKGKSGIKIWLAEGGNRIYECLNLASGGRTYLGPGAPGKQVDLTQLTSQDFSVAPQASLLSRKVEGTVMTFGAGRRGTYNCEAERNAELPNGASSLWLPVRLGATFTVTFFEENRPVSESDYSLEIETAPGVFGTRYDFFRVTNKSGHTWRNIRFIAETAAP